jgi:hypothetical protein
MPTGILARGEGVKGPAHLGGSHPGAGPIQHRLGSLVDYFRIGFGNFEGIWQHILEEKISI